MASLQCELEFLSELNKHDCLKVSSSKDYFRIEITTHCVHSFSVPIPTDYPADLQWNTPFVSKQLDPTQGHYRASLYPITAGVYEILVFYSQSIDIQTQMDAIKHYLESEEVDCSFSDSFEEIPEIGSVGSDFEEIDMPPNSIESIDTPSCSDQEASDDGDESDSTVVGEDEDILDSVLVMEPTPRARSRPTIFSHVLEHFGLSPDAARQLVQSSRNNICELRLCVELSNIKESGLYNGSGNSLQLRVVENNIKKWELKIWEFPEPCHLNSELLKYSPTDSCVTLEVTFPSEYPFVPPFLRIVSPPIQAGHVIMGGALFLDILLPKSCNYLGSPRAYSVSIALIDLFTQIVYSMVDGNARVLNAPQLLETYTYEKAQFVYTSIVGLLTIDWEEIIKTVRGSSDRQIINYNYNNTNYFNSNYDFYRRY